MGGAATFDITCRALYAEQARIRPTTVVTGMPNAPLAELSLRFGYTFIIGPCFYHPEDFAVWRRSKFKKLLWSRRICFC